MAITRILDATQEKTPGDLAREALWFVVHSLIALAILFVVWAVMTMAHPDPETSAPKVVATALAFLVPMIGGFLFTRIRHRDSSAEVARHTWITGLLLFAAVSVWVLDLPTGPGLCETCGPVEKLYRTFFDINHGSGLMGGDGLLAGAWIPLSLLGYAAGAAIGRRT